MYIVVGLGNPGRQYENSRHNVGFCVIDKLADKHDIRVETRKGRAYVGSGIIAGQRVLLAKPQTFMNLSGESVRSLVDFFKIDPAHDLLVIHDDVSLDVGQLRIRRKGSAGGHNGMKSILTHLGNNEFFRLKIGVGEKPKEYDLADYVLGHFSKGEREIMEESYDKAVSAVEMLISGDEKKAMNVFNTKPKKEKQEITRKEEPKKESLNNIEITKTEKEEKNPDAGN